MLNQLRREQKNNQIILQTITSISQEKMILLHQSWQARLFFWQTEIKMQVTVVSSLLIAMIISFLGASLMQDQWWWLVALLSLLAFSTWCYYLILCYQHLQALWEQNKILQDKLIQGEALSGKQKFLVEIGQIIKAWFHSR